MNERDIIENLLYSYARALDTGNLAAVAELFRQGAICDSEGNAFATGYDEVLAMYQGIVKIYPDCGTPKTQHVITNLILDTKDDNTAHSTSNYTVMQQLPDGNISCIIAGEYFSIFAKQDELWHFKEHHMRNRLTGDLSHHLLIEIDDITQRSKDGITKE